MSLRNKKTTLLALAALQLTCHQVILTAPPGSTLTLFANPEFIAANGAGAVRQRLARDDHRQLRRGGVGAGGDRLGSAGDRAGDGVPAARDRRPAHVDDPRVRDRPERQPGAERAGAVHALGGRDPEPDAV